MLKHVEERTGVDIAGLRLLQLRMLALHQLLVPCDFGEHSNTAHPWKRHFEQHERWRSLESHGPYRSLVTNTRATSNVSSLYTRTAKGRPEQGVVGIVMAGFVAVRFVR